MTNCNFFLPTRLQTFKAALKVIESFSSHFLLSLNIGARYSYQIPTPSLSAKSAPHMYYFTAGTKLFLNRLATFFFLPVSLLLGPCLTKIKKRSELFNHLTKFFDNGEKILQGIPPPPTSHTGHPWGDLAVVCLPFRW